MPHLKNQIQNIGFWFVKGEACASILSTCSWRNSGLSKTMPHTKNTYSKYEILFYKGEAFASPLITSVRKKIRFR